MNIMLVRTVETQHSCSFTLILLTVYQIFIVSPKAVETSTSSLLGRLKIHQTICYWQNSGRVQLLYFRNYSGIFQLT